MTLASLAQLVEIAPYSEKENLDLSPMEMPVIPATGKAFKLPVEHTNVAVEDGKIVRVHAETPADGGLTGILQQLGVDMPAPPG